MNSRSTEHGKRQGPTLRQNSGLSPVRLYDDISRVRIYIEGIVQGVGFRPFLHRLAEQHHILGWVRNTSSGLEGCLEGTSSSLDGFIHELRTSPPPMALIEEVKVIPEPCPDGNLEGDPDEQPGGASDGQFKVDLNEQSERFSEFTIRKSQIDPGSTLISPDIAICPECARELALPSDRRYRYPFINCTNCGPRYTIIESLPYDRDRTVMNEFEMCDDCRNEYHDIHDRRYHAQPDCCPVCGPQVFFVPDPAAENHWGTAHAHNDLCGENAFRLSQELLKNGGILAVKGIGGVHLACNAEDPAAVKRLRERKHRAEKPLAVMCRSLETVRRICRLSASEEALLTSPAHPIILLSKKEQGSFPELSFSSRLGVMLPYTPLHMLLLDGTYGGPDALVMTSGNVPGCPVITENEEALRALAHTADGFLLHDRRIRNRCDDSLVAEWQGHAYFYRRSRGYVPRPITLKGEKPVEADGIFAFGAEQKASFALGKGSRVFLSPYIGDLKNAETLTHYRSALETYCRLFRLRPSLYVCDLHPDYLSSLEASDASRKDALPLLKVQHHWAHMASCMADNRLDCPCFGIIWDGTGLGTDGTIWGGEFLEGDLNGFSRKGSIRPVLLPGGDKAVREIGRIALSLVLDAAGSTRTARVPLSEEKCRSLEILLSAGTAPSASSIGRLFDGVCALILGRAEADHEGEGAALVEALSPEETSDTLTVSLEELSYPVRFYIRDELRIFDTRPVITGILDDLEQGTDAGQIALRFMSTLCCMALDQCLALNPERKPVVLSGGVFQNRFLLSGITGLLEKNGFTVYTHRQVSTNDEGISLGQLAIAQKKRSMKHVFSNANEDQ
ncbi:carbamoyltransferase HypF [Mediterraneibacter glycyrrhizinilyticus]|nr:carbamoyltransferase HypF [Mediterraneibacter glycyrrhizinilyticus]MBM6854019.1 carbamoyltransferase HypF [Mediterraneibacter glycyrrhizinilyticus]